MPLRKSCLILKFSDRTQESEFLTKISSTHCATHPNTADSVQTPSRNKVPPSPAPAGCGRGRRRI